SLLHRLRAALDSSQRIKRPTTAEEWAQLRPSDFVELRGRFRPNPLSSSLRKIAEAIEVIQAMAQLSVTGDQKEQREQRERQKLGSKQLESIEQLCTKL